MNKSMKKPILITISLILFSLLCWGVYSGFRSIRDKTFNSGLTIGGYNGFRIGQQNGLQLIGQNILTQLEREGKITITFNKDNKPQIVTLIPDDNFTKN